MKKEDYYKIKKIVIVIAITLLFFSLSRNAFSADISEGSKLKDVQTNSLEEVKKILLRIDDMEKRCEIFDENVKMVANVDCTEFFSAAKEPTDKGKYRIMSVGGSLYGTEIGGEKSVEIIMNENLNKIQGQFEFSTTVSTPADINTDFFDATIEEKEGKYYLRVSANENIEIDEPSAEYSVEITMMQNGNEIKNVEKLRIEGTIVKNTSSLGKIFKSTKIYIVLIILIVAILIGYFKVYKPRRASAQAYMQQYTQAQLQLQQLNQQGIQTINNIRQIIGP